MYLGECSSPSDAELRQLKGVGPARAAAIKSAFLLAHRLRESSSTPLVIRDVTGTPLLGEVPKVRDLERGRLSLLDLLEDGCEALLARMVAGLAAQAVALPLERDAVAAMLERDGYIGLKDFRGQTIASFEREGWIFHGEEQKREMADTISLA